MHWESGTQHQMGGNIIQFYRCANGSSRFSLITVAFVRLWAPLCQSTPTYLPKAKASVSPNFCQIRASEPIVARLLFDCQIGVGVSIKSRGTLILDLF